MTAASARERTPFGNFQLRQSHLKTGGNPYQPGTPDHERFEAARNFPDMTSLSRPADHMSPEDLRSVQLTVATHAADADDLAHMLAMLGLDEGGQ